MDDRNHQTFRHGAGLRSSAPQMGRRTYFRMARSLSQAGKGFRSDNRQRRCLGVRCAHPNPHAATRKSRKANAIIMSQTLMVAQTAYGFVVEDQDAPSIAEQSFTGRA